MNCFLEITVTTSSVLFLDLNMIISEKDVFFSRSIHGVNASPYPVWVAFTRYLPAVSFANSTVPEALTAPEYTATESLSNKYTEAPVNIPFKLSRTVMMNLQAHRF